MPCIYFSKRKIVGKFPTYPRIEIKTSSKGLVKQLILLLNNRGFLVQTLESKSDYSTKVYLSGEVMLEKWKTEVGFGSERNLSKYLFWKKFGYYIPRSTPEQREILLKSPENPSSKGG